MRITACTSISNLFSGVQSAVLVLFVLDVLGLGTQTLGLVWALGAVGGLAGALLTGRVVAVVGEGRTIPLSVLAGALFGVGVPLAALPEGDSRSHRPPGRGDVGLVGDDGGLQHHAGELPAATLPARPCWAG